MDVVGGVLLSDGSECKILTGLDDHSRLVVCAGVMARATSRAVCGHFAEAMRPHGVPQEILTDNGKVPAVAPSRSPIGTRAIRSWTHMGIRCHEVRETRNLRQLADFVSEIG